MVVTDTDFIIDLMRARPSAVDRLRAIADGVAPLGVSVMTLMQLHHGLARVRRYDLEKQRILRALAGFTAHPVTAAIAELAGEMDGRLLARGARVDVWDVIIAATALHLREPVLTRNRRHFDRFDGLDVETYA